MISPRLAFLTACAALALTGCWRDEPKADRAPIVDSVLIAKEGQSALGALDKAGINCDAKFGGTVVVLTYSDRHVELWGIDGSSVIALSHDCNIYNPTLHGGGFYVHDYSGGTIELHQ